MMRRSVQHLKRFGFDILNNVILVYVSLFILFLFFFQTIKRITTIEL